MKGITSLTSRFDASHGKRSHGKTALVTGAGQGIGKATAVRLAGEGVFVGVLDRNGETASSTAAEILDFGGMALALPGDVADERAVEDCVRQIVSARGVIHILVNNAGFDRPGGFFKVHNEDFLAVWSVHLLGAVNCCHACAPIMTGAGRSSIVNVSSIYGRIGSRGESAYCSAKAALVGLTKSLAREWASRGIRVNAVLPGLTDTPAIEALMDPKVKAKLLAETPMGRSADPAEIAAAIAFLASDDSSFITGTTLEVTGGWNM